MQVKMTGLFNAFIQTMVIYLKMLTAETTRDSTVANNATSSYLKGSKFDCSSTGRPPLQVAPQFFLKNHRSYIKRGRGHYSSHPPKFIIHNHPTVQITLLLDVMSYRKVTKFW
jgi:hypothetical protein